MLDFILNPYLINLLLLVMWGFTILGNKQLKDPKKVFVIIASLQWILLSGLRHLSIGADTLTYKDSFYSISNQSWAVIFENFKNLIIFGQEGKEPGYTLFVKLIQLFTLNYQFYLIFMIIGLNKFLFPDSIAQSNKYKNFLFVFSLFNNCK